MNKQRIDRIVKTAKVLSDPSRVRLLLEIYERGELSCEKAEELTQLSQPTVSHHLKLLGESGLIHTEKQSRHLLLSPNVPGIEQFMELFEDLLDAKNPD
ncbi:MAG: metalloregulator ArsR/SmtB family transcription factor [Candidatus Marinimicrobia bacterium]|nr:metalloregulator ArsR/SmtB family transcription factor [Candidatus Neomarinimicrobiota bacterium]